MATVIDQLIVELQLDPKKFTEGQNEAVKDLRRMETEAGKHQKRLARETDKYTQSLSLLQGKLIAIAALFTGGMGIESFLSHVMQATSQTGYLAQSLGVSTKELGTWQAMAGSVGATAAEMTQGFSAIKNALAEWQISRAGPLANFSWMTQQTGNGPAVDISPSDEVSTVIEKMTKWHDAMIARGESPAVVNKMLRDSAGLPQGMINAIGLGSEGLKQRLKQFEQFAPTEADAKAFQDLSVNMARASQQAEKLGRAVALLATPGVIRFLESLNRIVEAFVKGGWIDGLKQLDAEASKGVGEATKSVGVDASGIGEKANEGWWGRFKSKFEWHNPFASRKGESSASAMPSGDGPGGASAPSPPSTVTPGNAAARPGEPSAEPHQEVVPKFTFPQETPREGAPVAPPAPAPVPGAPREGAPSATGNQSSDYLRERRQRYADEINNTPGLRERVGGMLVTEGTAQPTMESLLNRIDYVNTERAKRGQPDKTIDQMLTGGFYGPINRGELPGGIAQYKRNPAKYDRAIDRALGGSHVIGGYTDQGLPTDPNGSVRNAQRGLSFPFKKIGGNEFTDWAGGPRSRQGASDYRQMVEAGLAREARMKAVGPQSPLTTGDKPNVAARSFDRWRDIDRDQPANPISPPPVPAASAPRAAANLASNNSGARLALGSSAALMNQPKTVSNTRTSSVHIENMPVSIPPGASPSEYGNGIEQTLQRNSTVNAANEGLW